MFKVPWIIDYKNVSYDLDQLNRFKYSCLKWLIVKSSKQLQILISTRFALNENTDQLV